MPGRKHDTADFAAIRKGGYVLSEANVNAAAIIIGPK
jgi:transketolase